MVWKDRQIYKLKNNGQNDMAYYIKQQTYYVKISTYGSYNAYNFVTNHNFATAFNTRAQATAALEKIAEIVNNPDSVSTTDHIVERHKCTISIK
jgi:hypothetical protein